MKKIVVKALAKKFLPSLVRHVLTAVGALLLANGIDIPPELLGEVGTIITGLIMAALGMAWSGKDKAERVKEEIPPIINPPKGFFLSERSLGNLKGIDERLQKLAKIAITNAPYDYVVIEGLRSQERQNELINAGKSWISRSKHQDGKAFDFMAYDENGNGTWDLKYYAAITNHMKNISAQHGLGCEFGVDWKKVDAVHVQVA